jgi:hypothetical protein
MNTRSKRLASTLLILASLAGCSSEESSVDIGHIDTRLQPQTDPGGGTIFGGINYYEWNAGVKPEGNWIQYPDPEVVYEGAGETRLPCGQDWYRDLDSGKLYYQDSSGRWVVWNDIEPPPRGLRGFIRRGTTLFRVTCLAGASVCFEIAVDIATECGITVAAAAVVVSATASLGLAGSLCETPPPPPPNYDAPGQNPCVLARRYVDEYELFSQFCEPGDHWDRNYQQALEMLRECARLDSERDSLSQ